MRERVLLGFALTLALAACGGGDGLPFAAGVGLEPTLPEPRQGLLPTVAIAPADGWAAGETPVPAPGLAVAAFAQGLDHPRWLHVLPNGDVLVAETNKQPASARGLRSWVEKQIMRVAGAEVPSADRISLLRDADGDGVAETRSVLLDGLTSPFGMALVGDALYVADTDALLRFPYRPGETRIAGRGELVAALPAKPAQPALDEGPRREPGRAAALRLSGGRTAIMARTGWPPRRVARRSGRSTRRRARPASTPRACATPWASTSSPRRARSGPW